MHQTFMTLKRRVCVCVCLLNRKKKTLCFIPLSFTSSVLGSFALSFSLIYTLFLLLPLLFSPFSLSLASLATVDWRRRNESFFFTKKDDLTPFAYLPAARSVSQAKAGHRCAQRIWGCKNILWTMRFTMIDWPTMSIFVVAAF